jgi:hypothetical protein
MEINNNHHAKSLNNFHETEIEKIMRNIEAETEKIFINSTKYNDTKNSLSSENIIKENIRQSMNMIENIISNNTENTNTLKQPLTYYEMIKNKNF